MQFTFNVEALEMTLLLEGIFQRFGRDFRYHQRDYIHYKLQQFLTRHDIATLSALQEQILHRPNFINLLLSALDERSTGLFLHAEQMLKVRQVFSPWLRSCPAPKIWIPDCVCAEDVFALAIMLLEENLLHKTHLYVTGPNTNLLSEARQGKFSATLFVEYQKNYQRAGGVATLENYCAYNNQHFTFNPELGRNITWSEYHLATDASINEFEAIVCCGGLSCFSPYLRQRVVDIFYESQPAFGLLAILGQQPADAASHIAGYKPVSEKYGIHQRFCT